MATIVATHIGPFAFTVEGEVGSDGAIVADLTPAALVSEAGALLAADNLSDLDDADAALDNLGATTVGKALLTAEDEDGARAAIGVGGTTPLVVFLPDIISANAVVVSVVAPFDCEIVGADLWASATIAAGNLTATLAINGSAVTNGAMTLASGATSGTLGACTPTAANEAVARQGVIRVTVGGGNTAAGRGTVTIYLVPAVIV